jgi:hypothetical protein
MLAVILTLLLCAPVPLLRAESVSAEEQYAKARKLLNAHCLVCHRGKAAAGGFDLAKYPTHASILADPRRWNNVVLRVREHEMPPPGAMTIPHEVREEFTAWMTRELRQAACRDGLAPQPAPLRRLNRNEYASTVRDLLNIHINAGHTLPADGAGGEGFDNAAETLFLSPIHAEKYLEAARDALHYGSRDPRSRKAFIISEPGEWVSPEAAAQRNLEAFLPRAFRRPITGDELEQYLALYRRAALSGRGFEESLLFAFQGALISPHFLFLFEEPNPEAGPRLLGHYEIASRLSYFLWGSMPDKELFDLAAGNRLHEAEVIETQIARMLKDHKSLEFAERFVEQWLGTRELGRDIKPDPELFREYYDAELQSAIRYEPILFFQELLSGNHSLMNLLDSPFTILTNKLQRHYGLDIKGLSQQPKRVELPEGHTRGGLLGMSAVLAVSSLSHRTSPVLRGKWVLDALLGTPPPPPPPDVPELPEEHTGAAPRTVREKLAQHRQNPACASCHDRIDPIGFGLEHYDVIGRWRTHEAGKPVDAKGELPGGMAFEGVGGLKQVLLTRKDLFLRNLTAKMLGYSLGRGLSLEDDCTVDRIVEQLVKKDDRAQQLVRSIVLSVPFRYQPGTRPGVAVTQAEAKRMQEKP